VTPKPFLRRRPEETAESIGDLLSRGVSVAGIAPREGLTAKRSRPEMAGPAQDWGWARQRGIFRVCSLTEVDAWPGF